MEMDFHLHCSWLAVVIFCGGNNKRLPTLIGFAVFSISIISTEHEITQNVHLHCSWLALVRTITGPVSVRCETISSLVTWFSG